MREDGVDHINVSTFASTVIGKISSPEWRKMFYVPHLGDFNNARAFANWMASGGDEELRHNNKFYKPPVPVDDFRRLVIFAKYYQLCSMRTIATAERKHLALPWVMYKSHFSGIREFDRWVNYPYEIKPLVESITGDTVHRSYDWVKNAPDILSCVNHYLQIITGKDFIPFENLEKVSRSRIAAAKAVKDKQNKKRPWTKVSKKEEIVEVAQIEEIHQPEVFAPQEVSVTDNDEKESVVTTE